MEDPRLYRHSAEGPNDMPAHVESALSQTQLSIPVRAWRMLLGTWRRIYVFEHRRAPSTRELVLHFVGSDDVAPRRGSSRHGAGGAQLADTLRREPQHLAQHLLGVLAQERRCGGVAHRGLGEFER